MSVAARNGKVLPEVALPHVISPATPPGRAGKLAEPSILVGIGLSTVLALGWGLNWPASKLAMQQMDPLIQRSLTLVLGGAGLLLLARLFGASLRVPGREIRALAPVALLYVTGYHIAVAYGLPLVPAGRASIIANTVPLWVVPLSFWLLREAATGQRLLSLGLGLAGIVLLMSPDVLHHGITPPGPLLLLGAALSSAFGSIFMKSFRWTTSIMVLTGWAVFAGGAPVAAVALLDNTGPVLPSSLVGALALAFTVLVSTTLGQWCFFKLVVLYSPSVASIASLAVPVVGVFGSAILLGEGIGWIEVTSLLLVLSGLACLFYGRQIGARLAGAG